GRRHPPVAAGSRHGVTRSARLTGRVSPMESSASHLTCGLARQFYDLGWVTATGGGICIREGDHVLVAPSGVQKERMTPEQMFTISIDGTVIRRPADATLRPSDCSSLFMTAIRLRDAGAVIHTHSIHAVMATLLF